MAWTTAKDKWDTSTGILSVSIEVDTQDPFIFSQSEVEFTNDLIDVQRMTTSHKYNSINMYSPAIIRADLLLVITYCGNIDTSTAFTFLFQ